MRIPIDHEAPFDEQKRFETRARAAHPDRALFPSATALAALGLARGEGRYGKLLPQLAHVHLLVLDD